MGLGELDREMIPEGELAVAEKNEGSSWPEHEIVDAWVKKHWRGLDWGSEMIAELKKAVSEPRIAAEKLVAKYREELGKMEARALSAEAALEPAVALVQRRIDSIACMLGWMNTPPQRSLEGTIRAMKDRMRLAEDELRETRQTLSLERKGWREHLQTWAKCLGLPELAPNGSYTSGGVAHQVSRWQNVMEFYGLLGNWQGMKGGHEESACERDIGGRARAAMGKPDREVPDEDDDEVLDNGHDRNVCG